MSKPFSKSMKYFIDFSLPDPPAFQGVLQQNERLQSSERLFEGKVKGAESIVKDGGTCLFYLALIV